MGGEGPLGEARATVGANLRAIRERIAAGARAAGRDPSEITLVAATKYVGPAGIRLLADLGVEIFGENQVAAAARKAAAVGPGPRWHMIGHLQRNKVRRALELFELLQSLDSLRLAEAIQRRCEALDQPPHPALLEINIAREPQKTGFAPEEALGALRAIAGLDRIRVLGLMTMGPLLADPEAMRPHFRRLRELRDALAASPAAPGGLPILSMGMSADFGVAVEEGATMVRIGSALFRGAPADLLA